MNTNNIKTGLIKIPGALTSTGGDGNGQVGGVVAYTGDVYDATLEKNQSEVNSDFANALAETNDSISSVQDDIQPIIDSTSLRELAEYDGLDVIKGLNANRHNVVRIDDKKLAMHFGYDNTISNSYKLAFGFGQQLDIPSNTFVIGQRNSYEPNAAFIVGNGTLDGITNNAFVIGRDGNFWAYGVNGYTGQYTGASEYNSVNDIISDLDTKTTSLQNTINASSTAWSNLAPATNVTLTAITGLNATNAQDAFSEINTVIAPLRTGSISSTLVSDTNFNTTQDQINLSVPYDISAANSSAEYTDLEDALGSNGSNIPQNLRVGGLTVKFVNSDTEEYEQWRLKSSSWSTNTSSWTNSTTTRAEGIYWGSDKLTSKINELNDDKSLVGNTNASALESKINALISCINSLVSKVVFYTGTPFALPQELNSQLNLSRYSYSDTTANTALLGSAICGQALCGNN